MSDYLNDIEPSDDLNQDWMRQPMLYMKYADLAAEANYFYEVQKDKYSVFLAELDTEIRQRLSKEGGKVTEAIVNAEIMKSQERANEYEKVLKKRNEAETIKNAVIAMDHKKKALENLTTLWVSGYFSVPKASSQNVTEKIINSAQSRQRNKLNKE